MEVNKLKLQQLLSSQGVLTDISLVVMVDLLMSGYFCVARLKDRVEERPFRWYTRLLRHLPSLLIFPALFYLQITLFFSVTGTDFRMISDMLAGVILLLFGSASFFLRKIIPEKDLIIELIGMLSFLICALVICCTIFHPASIMIHHAEPIDWIGCATTLGLLSVLFVTGFLMATIIRMYKQKKDSKQ